MILVSRPTLFETPLEVSLSSPGETEGSIMHDIGLALGKETSNQSCAFNASEAHDGERSGAVNQTVVVGQSKESPSKVETQVANLGYATFVDQQPMVESNMTRDMPEGVGFNPEGTVLTSATKSGPFWEDAKGEDLCQADETVETVGGSPREKLSQNSQAAPMPHASKRQLYLLEHRK